MSVSPKKVILPSLAFALGYALGLLGPDGILKARDLSLSMFAPIALIKNYF